MSLGPRICAVLDQGACPPSESLSEPEPDLDDDRCFKDVVCYVREDNNLGPMKEKASTALVSGCTMAAQSKAQPVLWHALPLLPLAVSLWQQSNYF